MATLQRKSTEYKPESLYINDDIVVLWELEIDGDIVKSGDKVKLKGDNRTLYKFRCLARNVKLGTEWVDLISETGFRAVRPEMLKLIRVVKKRSRAHKKNGAVA